MRRCLYFMGSRSVWTTVQSFGTRRIENTSPRTIRNGKSRLMRSRKRSPIQIAWKRTRRIAKRTCALVARGLDGGLSLPGLMTRVAAIPFTLGPPVGASSGGFRNEQNS
jgi:hypothetical protein